MTLADSSDDGTIEGIDFWSGELEKTYVKEKAANADEGLSPKSRHDVPH